MSSEGGGGLAYVKAIYIGRKRDARTARPALGLEIEGTTDTPRLRRGGLVYRITALTRVRVDLGRLKNTTGGVKREMKKNLGK